MKANVAVRAAVSRTPRLVLDKIPDPYKRKPKIEEPSVCGGCGAVFHKGRWQWLPAPKDAHTETCQACLRMKDSFPAGLLKLEGAFLRGNKVEVLRVARNCEEKERRDHPLHRIMAVEEAGATVVIKTTDIHLPRRIGEALRRAFHGELELQFDRGGYFVRATWRR